MGKKESSLVPRKWAPRENIPKSGSAKQKDTVLHVLRRENRLALDNKWVRIPCVILEKLAVHGSELCFHIIW